jgi:metal-sulfur cluster biosynthetic enzyme
MGAYVTGSRAMTAPDEDILNALRGIIDPELGINIVDLGLVYRAERSVDQIDVAITLTAPSCPLGELILEEARCALEQRYRDGPPIHVQLVWEPPWTRDRMSDAARQLMA